jgi:hypothetical protein
MNRENARRNPLSPRNDYFFKRIFGDARDKEILTDFLKHIGLGSHRSMDGGFAP